MINFSCSIYFLVLFFLAPIYSVLAQDIVLPAEDTYKYYNAVFVSKDTTMEISYYIQAGKKLKNFAHLYNVELYYSKDGGQTFRGPMKAVKGDVGMGVKATLEKTLKIIKWKPLEDDDDFSGQNIVLEVRPTMYIPANAKHNKGPQFGALNIVMPGLGDYFVRPGSGRALLPIFLGALIGGGVYANKMANDSYNSYLTATEASQMNKSYDEAKIYDMVSKGLVYTAIGIWGIDVITGVIKGFRNQGFRAKYENQTLKKSTAYTPKLELFGGYAGTAGQLGVRLKF